MRCSEARRRLIESGGVVSADDRELKQHLLSCFECTALARAEQALCRDLEAAADETITDDVPLSVLKTRVEARADSILNAKTKENFIMSTLIRQVKKRPSLGITFGVAAIVLAFTTLIPFSFENTVGYEVAIAGVDKNLAMDNEKINELCIALGLENVNVDVGDCETTCVLKISDLESEGDVEIIVRAFDELGNCILEEISEVHDSESMSLLKHVRKNIFISEGEGPDGEEVHRIVIDALCHLDSSTEGGFSIWVTDEGDTLIFNNRGSDGVDCSGLITIDEAALGQIHEYIDGEGNVIAIELLEGLISSDKDGAEHGMIYLDDGDLDKPMFIVRDDNGELHEIDMTDPDAMEKLAALGIEYDVINSEDGKTRSVFLKKGDGETVVDYDDALEKEGDPTALPDGLELKQNHPNPFNPTTAITFTIPETDRVLLEIYNVNGQKVRTLLDAVVTAGEMTVEWDSKDDSRNRVSSGIYLYRLTVGNFTTSKKMTLLK